ncbi:hypothetical protein DACRYDRAFT_109039 [Dacryopinax primogenitus]|uniref:Uncharacterized protein n=1 Tax=Dacryopinax primogenitus (strain DJM 731) TaxID=1858805 RepID=M5FX44_DACPD|nr:uncharacterized protein DACRYDRAFT_109039 [Dacryopinax primogenitus]EJU00300.1 hypothetical protein DACRYDRAFT_109039 [Dacryopinax primogenitus]
MASNLDEVFIPPADDEEMTEALPSIPPPTTLPMAELAPAVLPVPAAVVQTVASAPAPPLSICDTLLPLVVHATNAPSSAPTQGEGSGAPAAVSAAPGPPAPLPWDGAHNDNAASGSYQHRTHQGEHYGSSIDHYGDISPWGSGDEYSRLPTPDFARGSSDTRYCDSCTESWEPYPWLALHPTQNSELAICGREQLADNLVYNCVKLRDVEQELNRLWGEHEEHADEIHNRKRDFESRIARLEDSPSNENLTRSLDENARMSSRMDHAQRLLSNTHDMLLHAQRDAEIQGSHHRDESDALTDEIGRLKKDVSRYRIECDEHRSENDRLKGKLSTFNSAPPPLPPRAPLPSAARKVALPSASHEADDLYDVPMDVGPIEEAPVPASATSAVAKVFTVARVPPVAKVSAIALGKRPTVDKLPSAHPRKMQSLVTATSSSRVHTSRIKNRTHSIIQPLGTYAPQLRPWCQSTVCSRR